MKNIIGKLIIGLGLLMGTQSEASAQEVWTHRFERLTLEEAKNAARKRVRMPQRARELRDGWNPFNFPNGDIYTEFSVTRTVSSPYSQKSYSNLNLNVQNPNHAVFWNVGLQFNTTDTIYKWFVRMANIGFLYVESCDVVGFTGAHNFNPPPALRQYPMEHAFYCEVVYGCYFNNCLFQDLGGHGIYLAYRPRPHQQYAPQNPFFDRKPRYFINNVSLIDTEQDASRGAHSITFFDPGDGDFPGDILVQDTCVINGWDFERYQWNNTRYPISTDPDRVRSCGTMVVHNYQEFPDEGWPTNSLTLRRVVFWQVKGKHSMGDLRNIRTVVFEDCFFRAQDHMNPRIDLGGMPNDPRFKCPERVVIRNCKSDGVTLRIWKNATDFDLVDLNTVGTEYVWTPQ